MRTRTLVLIAVVALAAGACHGSKGSASRRGADADAALGGQSGGDSTPAAGAGAAGATATTKKTANGTAATRAKANASSVSSVAPAPAAGQPYTMDSFDRRAHMPPGAVPVVKGHSSRAEWRLYVFRDDKKRTCLQFADQSAGLDSGAAGSGGAGGTCNQHPPLDRSTASGTGLGDWAYGLTAPQAVKVRFEHTGGASETFDAVAAAGYTEHFYAGELLSQAPISRIVALDASGKVIAERTDNAALNISG